MSEKQQEQQQAQEQPNILDKYNTIQRIYNYEFVHNSINYGKSWYDYIKDSNALVKTTLEMGENSAAKVGTPILNTLEKYDGLVKKFDDLGVSSLDIVEKRVQGIKTTGDSLIKSIDQSCDSVISTTVNYTPNKVIDLAQKTSQLIDNLIDSILPPPEGEDLNKLTDEEKFELEKRMEFLLKLRKRLNVTSITHIPSNSIKAVSGASSKSLHFTIDKINDIATKVQSLSVPAGLTKQAIDSLYSALDACVAQLAGLSVYIKKIDLSETLISLGELSKTIKESKIQILNIEDQYEKMNKFKEDASAILKRALDILNDQMGAGKEKLEGIKNKDHVYINSAINLLEDTLQKFSDVLTFASKKLEAPSSPNITAENESTHENESTNENESSSNQNKKKSKGKKHVQSNN